MSAAVLHLPFALPLLQLWAWDKLQQCKVNICRQRKATAGIRWHLPLACTSPGPTQTPKTHANSSGKDRAAPLAQSRWLDWCLQVWKESINSGRVQKMRLIWIPRSSGFCQTSKFSLKTSGKQNSAASLKLMLGLRCHHPRQQPVLLQTLKHETCRSFYGAHLQLEQSCPKCVMDLRYSILGFPSYTSMFGICEMKLYVVGSRSALLWKVASVLRHALALCGAMSKSSKRASSNRIYASSREKVGRNGASRGYLAFHARLAG